MCDTIEVGQQWAVTGRKWMTGDDVRTVIAVGPNHIAYDTGCEFKTISRANFLAQGKLIPSKIKFYWVAYRYDKGERSLGYYENKAEADAAATGPYLFARGEIEYAEGDGLPVPPKRVCNCSSSGRGICKNC